MTPRFYKPSGGFSPVGILIGLVVALIICFCAGFAYAYLCSWIPLIWLRFFFIIGLAFAIAVAGNMIGNFGKVRSRPLALVLGLVVAGIANWLQWVAYFHAQSDPGLWIIDPRAIYALLQVMAENGVWEIFDWEPTGGALWGFWIVEAGIISAAALVGAVSSEGPFCEVTGQWASNEHPLVPMALPQDEAAQADRVARDPVNALVAAPEPDEDDSVFLQAKLASIQENPERGTWFVTVERVSLSWDDEGKMQEGRETVMPWLIIDHAQAQRLLAARGLDGLDEPPVVAELD